MQHPNAVFHRVPLFLGGVNKWLFDREKIEHEMAEWLMGQADYGDVVVELDRARKVATAYVNGQEVQLSYELKNGDVVSVSTSEDARPQLDWLRMAQRRSTRAKLRAYFREEQRLYEAARQKTIDSAM